MTGNAIEKARVSFLPEIQDILMPPLTFAVLYQPYETIRWFVHDDKVQKIRRERPNALFLGILQINLSTGMKGRVSKTGAEQDNDRI